MFGLIALKFPGRAAALKPYGRAAAGTEMFNVPIWKQTGCADTGNTGNGFMCTALRCAVLNMSTVIIAGAYR